MSGAAGKLQESASAGAAAKQVDLDIQAYQKARNVFVNAVREHLKKQDGGVTLSALIKHDIVALLCCPLTSDPVQGIQIEALKNVGQIGKVDKTAAAAVAASGVVDSMVLAQTHPNPRIQEAANQSLCSLSEADDESAQTVLDTGLLHCIKQQLDQRDELVKESGIDTVSSIASKSAEKAAAVLDDELLDKIVEIVGSTVASVSLLTSACTCLSNVAQHTPELAKRVLNAGSVPPTVAMLTNKNITDPKLRAAALRMLSHVAKHETEIATAVVKAGAVQPCTKLVMDDLNPHVRHAAAAVLQQLATRTPYLSEVVASAGCVSALLVAMSLDRGSPFAMPSTVALAHIGSFAKNFAKAVNDAGGVTELVAALSNKHSGTATAAAWGLHHMAMHGTVIADKLAEAGVMMPLLAMYKEASPDPDSEAYKTSKAALKETIKQCSQHRPLIALLADSTPPELVVHVLKQVQGIMKTSVISRRDFVTTGALMRIQRLEGDLDDKGKESIKLINELFPADVVNYYRHGMTAHDNKQQ